MNAWIVILAAGLGSYLFRLSAIVLIDRITMPAYLPTSLEAGRPGGVRRPGRHRCRHRLDRPWHHPGRGAPGRGRRSRHRRAAHRLLQCRDPHRHADLVDHHHPAVALKDRRPTQRERPPMHTPPTRPPRRCSPPGQAAAAQKRKPKWYVRRIRWMPRSALLVAGYVLVTIREALAVAPSLVATRVAVVRASQPDAYGLRRLECLLATVCASSADRHPLG